MAGPTTFWKVHTDTANQTGLTVLTREKERILGTTLADGIKKACWKLRANQEAPSELAELLGAMMTLQHMLPEARTRLRQQTKVTQGEPWFDEINIWNECKREIVEIYRAACLHKKSKHNQRDLALFGAAHALTTQKVKQRVRRPTKWPTRPREILAWKCLENKGHWHFAIPIPKNRRAHIPINGIMTPEIQATQTHWILIERNTAGKYNVTLTNKKQTGRTV